jgi:hypothetical protein
MAQILPPLDDNLKQINTIISWFLWNGEIFRFPLSILQRTKKEGFGIWYNPPQSVWRYFSPNEGAKQEDEDGIGWLDGEVGFSGAIKESPVCREDPHHAELPTSIWHGFGVPRPKWTGRDHAGIQKAPVGSITHHNESYGCGSWDACNRKMATHRMGTRVGRSEWSTRAWIDSHNLIPGDSWPNSHEWTPPADKNGADGCL